MLVAATVHAQNGQPTATIGTGNGAALLVGAGHALTFRAPKAWVLDTRSGRAQGLQTVFYPKGSQWATSPAVMYCMVVPRRERFAELASMLEYEAARFRNSSPTAQIAEEPAIATDTGKQAVVRRFTGGPNGTYEQTAYIQERFVMVMVVLSCRTPEAFSASLPAFQELVASYRFLADDAENIQRVIEAAEDDAQ